MEDSRNIIKAIDALTLKAGGEVVDSKNITEAIDHLKEVYSQEVIGIDDTLSQEGLAADAKAAGNAIDALSDKMANVFVYEIFTDAGSSDWKLESTNGNFPSVFIFGANGAIINQTIQVLNSGVDTIFNGDPNKNLNPVKISNTTFSVSVSEYARLLVISRTALSISKITS